MSLQTKAGGKQDNTKNLPFGGYFQRDVPSPDAELTSTDADSQMVRDIGRQVTDIITDESLSSGKQRKREIRKRLKALQNGSGGTASP